MTNPNTGNYITQATLSTITYEVYDTNLQSRIVAPTTVTISSSVFDTLQTGGDEWDLTDPTGYNFRFMIPGATAFPTNHFYEVSFTFTPSSGSVFYLVCQLTTIKNRAGDT